MTLSLPTGADVLVLVQRALDELDDVPLSASTRRAVRIANLLGDTRVAVRLGLEVKATGGHPPANAEATRRLMADPSVWGDTSGPAEAALSEYMAERTNEDGLIVSHSVDELEFWRAERQPPAQISDAQYGVDLANQIKMLEILTRVRHLVFTLLCAWERQLAFSQQQATALDAVSGRVDALLAERAPAVVDQFNAAFRRLRDASESNRRGACIRGTLTGARVVSQDSEGRS